MLHNTFACYLCTGIHSSLYGWTSSRIKVMYLQLSIDICIWYVLLWCLQLMKTWPLHLSVVTLEQEETRGKNASVVSHLHCVTWTFYTQLHVWLTALCVSLSLCLCCLAGGYWCTWYLWRCCWWVVLVAMQSAFTCVPPSSLTSNFYANTPQTYVRTYCQPTI